MAGKSSKLFCTKCYQSGGTLTRRQAGNGDKNEYFYMMHYDPTKKSKKRSCYLGYAGLTRVGFEDERVSLYRKALEEIDTDMYKNLDVDERIRIWRGLLSLLVDMGWPKRFVLEKHFADTCELYLMKKYAKVEEELKNSAFSEKRRLKPDYSKFDDYLNEDLSELFRSDDFREIKLKLGLDNIKD
jgi:hypothetical protein